mmetsp:Transcript_1385/g.2834  ORF Transcript_1385/g.2834 Transcript_1385/m.2834 type:complete len:101 (+) Transcript_1385:171-473(+)
MKHVYSGAEQPLWFVRGAFYNVEACDGDKRGCAAAFDIALSICFGAATSTTPAIIAASEMPNIENRASEKVLHCWKKVIEFAVEKTTKHEKLNGITTVTS